MNICVFLSASDLDVRYTGPAREFGELLTPLADLVFATDDVVAALARAEEAVGV